MESIFSLKCVVNRFLRAFGIIFLCRKTIMQQ